MADSDPKAPAAAPSAPTGSKADKRKADDEAKLATSIHVKVYSPFQVYYDEDALSVSAENATGPFDVLPRHHSFITLLNACELEIRADKGDKRIKISRGVMHVRNNKITVFLDV
jgi:F0F1-type ATP synthase epsilon subunit